MKKDPGNFPIFQMIFPEKKLKNEIFFSKFGSLKYPDIPYDLSRKIEKGHVSQVNHGSLVHEI